MGKNYNDNYITLQQLKENNKNIEALLNCLDIALNEGSFNTNQIRTELAALRAGKKLKKVSPKLDMDFQEEQDTSITSIVRNYQNDRKFNLETVQIKQFSREHSRGIDEATIHIGMSADEYARSFNALAITIGRNIFFRNGAYKPESEEGRKILAHELTHVAQNEKPDEYRNATRKELEREAAREEVLEEHRTDPVIDYRIGNRIYKLKKSQIAAIERNVESELDNWVESQEKSMSPQEYYDLLLRYEKYTEEKLWRK